jgi:hypothetical protein
MIQHDGRGLCCSCARWLEGACRSKHPLATEWWARLGVPGRGYAAWRVGAPRCAAWDWYRPISPGHDQSPHPSQWVPNE